MQAALMLRSKSRERRKARLKRGHKHDLPSNIATRQIAPFPRYPPTSWIERNVQPILWTSEKQILNFNKSDKIK
ncbi:Uncharacterized protein OBRU01_12232 [Operophtera brumata]|uniref:Uncharacterized protein n=1 Tax=Operophtera brumata TaxID=104452 RepID=A0A0L7L5B0_OPEBR|nr:Uncharacterized protein OBRU01_12232 [Operophtera brumata]